MKKILIALDFDHTIINENSDTFITKLVPDEKIPQFVKQLYKTNGWTCYMGEIFKIIHENQISSDTIFENLKKIPLVEGMKDLFQNLPYERTEFIIISDSNTIFIDCILKNIGIDKYISKIFTNPASFDDNGCLTISKFHNQDWCSLSTDNLCKGYILAQYVENRLLEGIHFTNISYVGDGFNDFCPSMRLLHCDHVYPRIGYSLITAIAKMEKEQGLLLKAKVIPWKSGEEILNSLLPVYEQIENALPPVPRLFDPRVV